MKKLLLTGLILSVAIAQACGDETTGNHPIQRSALTHETAPQVARADLDKQVTANNETAFELFRRARVSDENTFIAPYSISSALAMLSGAAAGQTAQEIATALRFELPQSTLHPTFNSINLQLASRGKDAQGADGDFRLTIDNALWLQQGHKCSASYLDTLAVSYGAGVHELDFAQKSEHARSEINSWVSQKTNARIPELLHKDDLTAQTLFVLTNAVYFNGGWDEPFDETLTQQQTFHAAAGDKPVSMMSGRKDKALYSSGAGYQAIALPYDKSELSMLVLLPDAGTLTAFEDALDAAKLDTILAGLQSQPVDLALPTFQFKKRTQLKSVLMAMGMVRAFDDNGLAELPGLCQDCKHPIKISKVVHEAFIKVNEKGAEAAGATAVIGADSGVAMPPPEVIKMTVDRPFLFVILDHGTNTVLFVGRVLDPTL